MADLGDDYTVPNTSLREVIAVILRDRVEQMLDDEGKGLPAGAYKAAHQILDENQREYDYMLDEMDMRLDTLAHKLLDHIELGGQNVKGPDPQDGGSSGLSM